MIDKNVLVFDIETVADTEGYRRIHQIPKDVSEKEVYQLMCQERLANSGNTFQRHHLQKVAAISLLLDDGNNLKIWTLGRNQLPEKMIVSRFFQGVDKLSPTLVSWNGGGFDLPVLQYRALVNGVAAKHYFEVGDEDKSMKFNNYLSRFHWKHIDMMDVLSGYQMRAVAPLNDIAKMIGMPGKLDVDGGQVQDMWFSQQFESICDYCETDVLNTYGVYLRFELLRGNLSEQTYTEKVEALKEFVSGKSEYAHFAEFLDVWLAQNDS